MMREFSKTKGLVIAATSSNVGKTSVASAVCGALREKGYVVQPFKVGPDFVDPTYLTLASGRTCMNLDGFPNPTLMPFFYEDACRAQASSPAADIAIVEGVMGLYDGLGPDGTYSTAWVARALDLPVVLLVDAKAAATSIAATVKGFATLSPLVPRIVGVIANRVSSAGHAELIASALARFTGIPLVGWLPAVRDEHFPSRHLGLIPALERTKTKETLAHFTTLVHAGIDLAKLAGLAETPKGDYVSPEVHRFSHAPAATDTSPLRIAIAYDDAFCFLYEQNCRLLRDLGADIRFVSPLRDDALPADVDALLLPGGYPEEFGEPLAANENFIASVRDFAHRHPIYAECGGMLYLTRAVEHRGVAHSGVGILPGTTVVADRLQRFGYVVACALRDNLFFTQGERVRAHEFHYSRIEHAEPEAFSVCRVSRQNETWRDGFVGSNGQRILATYLHLNFYACPQALKRFLEAVADARDD